MTPATSVMSEGFTTNNTPTNITNLSHNFIGPKKYPILAEDRHVNPTNELNRPKNMPEKELSINKRDG